MQSDEESPETKYTDRGTSALAGRENEQAPTLKSPRSVGECPEPENNACGETRPGDIDTGTENAEEPETQETNREPSKRPDQVAKQASALPGAFVSLQRLQEPQQVKRKTKTLRGQAANAKLLGGRRSDAAPTQEKQIDGRRKNGRFENKLLKNMTDEEKKERRKKQKQRW